MRKLLIFAAMIFLGALLVAQEHRDTANANRHEDDAAVSKSAADDPILRRVSDEWKEAYNAKDASRVASLYTEDG